MLATLIILASTVFSSSKMLHFFPKNALTWHTAYAAKSYRSPWFNPAIIQIKLNLEFKGFVVEICNNLVHFPLDDATLSTTKRPCNFQQCSLKEHQHRIFGIFGTELQVTTVAIRVAEAKCHHTNAPE